jgi:hypothetical protein
VAAARDLQRSESPLRTRVSVLEATPRLGGKIRTESFSDEVVRLDGRAPAWGFQANENPSQLRVHDRYGHRVDEIRFHPAWHRLMGTAIAHGLHAALARGRRSRSPCRARGALLASHPGRSGPWLPDLHDPRRGPRPADPARAGGAVGVAVYLHRL